MYTKTEMELIAYIQESCWQVSFLKIGTFSNLNVALQINVDVGSLRR